MIQDPSYYDQFMAVDFGHWKLYVHEQQYYLGRVYLWAAAPGPIDLFERSDEELAQFKQVVCLTKDALGKLFHPDRYNYAALANVAECCHVHIIPRYQSIRHWKNEVYTDEQWGKNYAPYPKRKMKIMALYELRDSLNEMLADPF